MNIAQTIKDHRKANGWTLREVSARTGLSISYISDIERGRTNPSLKTCIKLARVFGVEVGKLFEQNRNDWPLDKVNYKEGE